MQPGTFLLDFIPMFLSKRGRNWAYLFFLQQPTHSPPVSVYDQEHNYYGVSILCIPFTATFVNLSFTFFLLFSIEFSVNIFKYFAQGRANWLKIILQKKTLNKISRISQKYNYYCDIVIFWWLLIKYLVVGSITYSISLMQYWK